MSGRRTADPNTGRERQALKRPLTQAEIDLANGLERIFRSGVMDYVQVALLLQHDGIQPPSGAPGPWSPALLESELAIINASLDRAYEGAS